MLDIGRVLNQDRLVRALTSVNRKAFYELLAALVPCTNKLGKLNLVNEQSVEDAKHV